ncbi:MAG: sulfotransferase family protein [Phycisphaerae bacterium]
MPAPDGHKGPATAGPASVAKGLARRTARRIAHALRLVRPVFILAPPRSGSTLLFDALAATRQFHYYPVENDWVWWRLFPPDRLTEPSDLVTAEDVAHREGELRNALCDQILSGYRNRFTGRQRLMNLASLLLRPGRPLLDKTIANCFHLDALWRVFPDARYIFLVRDPRANISSMMEGWTSPERFGKTLVKPSLRELSRRSVHRWCYPVPPGWQRVIDRPLAEICAWSWKRHIEATLDFFDRTNVNPTFVRYEELTSRPAEVLDRIARRLCIRIPPDARERWSNMPLSRTTVSPPDPHKWQRLHGDEIRAVLPHVMETARRIGYDVSADSSRKEL